MTLARVIEALLFSAQKPLSIREMTAAIKGAGPEDELLPNEFARTSEAQVAGVVEELKIEYVEQQRAFQLVEKAEGWQLTTDPAPTTSERPLAGHSQNNRDQISRWASVHCRPAKPVRSVARLHPGYA